MLNMDTVFWAYTNYLISYLVNLFHVNWGQ